MEADRQAPDQRGNSEPAEQPAQRDGQCFHIHRGDRSSPFLLFVVDLDLLRPSAPNFFPWIVPFPPPAAVLMYMINDTMNDPLGEYVRTGAPEAFRRLVEAHIDAVHSQCRRQLRDPAAAEDVTQMVFISLAQKASRISPNAVLDGWLFTATRYCCATHQRAAARRRSAERKAAIMRKEAVESGSFGGDFSSHAEPILDDAIADLGQRDREAVLLRFFRGRSLREVGDVLGVSEDAAKHRVLRAVEKLRGYFARRGVLASSDALATFLGCAVKPAAPGAIQAAVHVALNPSALTVTGHAAGLLSKTIWTWPKVAAGFFVAGSITTAAVIASHGAFGQSPAAQPTPAMQPAPAAGQENPATQSSSQSTPLDTLAKLCSALESNDVTAIDECLCGDGNNPASADMGRASIEGEAAVYRLSKDWRDKFGQPMAVSGFSFATFGKESTESALRGTLDFPGGPQVTIDGDVAQLRIPLPPEFFTGTGPNRMSFLAPWSGAMIVFNRVGSDWKINTDRTINFIINVARVDGNNTDVVELGAKIEQGVGDALNAVAAKIEDGSLPTRAKAVKAVQTGLMQAFRDNGVQGASFAVLPVVGG
jgi:RNA polymerase sigma factor (sigma-70 family)